MPLLVLLLVITFAPAVRADDAASMFPQFCDEWMQRLAVREQRNVAHIQWQQNDGGVKGDYVGYTQDHTCVTKEGTKSVPVGKITYVEIRYEKQGGTVADAEQSVARPVESTEITEIFRYSDGKWIY